ncbi:hypothetical protein QUF72_00785 [Desulfobacterales bacterium HSG2]|nr:hypothetical protein [Desulfobacterales bacterium HSG2]
MKISVLLLILLVLWQPPLSRSEDTDVQGIKKNVGDFSSCRTCHKGIETLDENHGFPCEQCHLLPENRHRSLTSHDPVIRHPAASSHAEMFCAGCHQKEISDFRNSLHYTLAGIISQTRYLWGAQPDPTPRYSASAHESLGTLPASPRVVQSPADLADDLLRRKCLSCHPGAEPPRKRGFYRGLGCAACHLLYENDGVYRGKDRIMKGKRGYPAAHRFCRPIPVRQCLHCHNGPRVGADYAGRFEHDYHQSYRTPIRNGVLPERTYLTDHHRLKPDIHFERGILCTDCHDRGDVMGRGDMPGSQQEAVRARCRNCHVPDKSVAAHTITQMSQIHCVGCHSAWGFADYGPSLLRDDRKNLSRWSLWRLQGDADVANRFDEQGRFLGPVPGPGPWFLAWRFRRWEYLTLGVDSKARIVPFRPRYQYSISFVDRNGRVVLDSVVPERGDGSGPGWAYMPFYPHTIRRRGRNCEACHGQTLAAGGGLWEGQGPDLVMTKPSPPVYPSMRLLSESEKRKLLEKTEIYRQVRPPRF